MILGAKKETVTCIFENPDKDVLLMLRDDKPEIPFPNRWYIPGGGLEVYDQTPLDAMIREVMEEFQIELGEVLEWKRYEWEDKNETVFVKRPSLIIPKRIDLQEGQEIRFMNPEEIIRRDLAFHDNEIMRDYFNER